MFTVNLRSIVRRRTILITACLVLSLLSIPAFSAEDPIKIGIIDDLSGRSAAFTNSAVLAWKMVVADFNSRGGLRGRKLQIITADDKYNPQTAQLLAEKLITEDKVDFLGGASGSSCAGAISEVARKHKTIFMVHIAKDHSITADNGHKYIFRACFDTEIEGRTGGKYAGFKKYKNWFVIGEDYEYARSMASSFWNSLLHWNPRSVKVGEAWPKLMTEDYSVYLKQIIDARPTAVFAAFGGSGRVTFIKQAQKAGLFESTRVFMTLLADSSMPGLLKESMPAKNAFGSAQYLYYFPRTAANDAFLASYTAFAKSNGVPTPNSPSYAVFGGYCAAKFMVEALNKAGNTDSDLVVAALEGLTIDTPVGPITMRPCDHQAMAPVIWGALGKVEGFSAPVLFQPLIVRAEDVAASCEEVLKRRK